MAALVAVALTAAGCAPDGRGSVGARERSEHLPALERSTSTPLPSTDVPAGAPAVPRVPHRLDSVLAAFQRVPPLTAREVAELRQDRNAEQIEAARGLGVRASGDAAVDRLLRQGRLVALGDSTAWWVLREMDHSVPYVTPDTRAMLQEMGRRFHARLDAAGLPRYRFKITSALRTDASQAALRRTNPNASRITSAHEFGTTVDVSHERFAPPAEALPEPAAEPGDTAASELEMLEEAGVLHARALQAELGRTIGEMRDQGALHVMMENRQPVFHMTLARPFAADGGAGCDAAPGPDGCPAGASRPPPP